MPTCNDCPTLSWRKSRASSGVGECVEVAGLDSSVYARDSRDQSGAVLSFTSSPWREFLRRVKSGELDLASNRMLAG